MKRSKMVELLLEYDDELLPMQAEDIIKFLESQGMLPPAYSCLEKSKHQKTGETLYAATRVIKYEWEPENEAK